MRRWALVGALLCTSFLMTGTGLGQTAEQETPVLAKKLAEQLIARDRHKVTALDFNDIQGRPNEAVELVMIDGITVLDRANIASIMAEHQLNAEGLVKPENAKKLGQFSGVEAIIIGNLASMDESVVLTVKAISTETAEVVAAGRMKLGITKDIQRMLDQSVTGNRNETAGSEGAGATALEGEAIATREVGPITIVLRSVARHTVQSGQAQIPAIRCTFDLANRNLQKSVAVAANARIAETRYQRSPEMAGFVSAITTPVACPNPKWW